MAPSTRSRLPTATCTRAATSPNAGGSGANYLAVWNGAAWQSVCAPLSAGVLSLEVVGNTLYVGGSFLNVNGDPAADQLIKCDVPSGGYIGPTVDSDADLDGGVQALVSDASGNLYAGGTFINMDGITQADYVAKYNGASWSAMGAGLDPANGAINTANVDSLATDGTNVFVGADDPDVAGIPAADHVARWDGAAWNAVGSGPGGDGWLPATAAVNGLVSDGARLFATGEWADAGGDPLADDVGVFDGSSWSHLGSNSDTTNGPWLGTGNAIARFGGARRSSAEGSLTREAIPRPTGLPPTRTWPLRHRHRPTRPAPWRLSARRRRRRS